MSHAHEPPPAWWLSTNSQPCQFHSSQNGWLFRVATFRGLSFLSSFLPSFPLPFLTLVGSRLRLQVEAPAYSLPSFPTCPWLHYSLRMPHPQQCRHPSSVSAAPWPPLGHPLATLAQQSMWQVHTLGKNPGHALETVEYLQYFSFSHSLSKS